MQTNFLPSPSDQLRLELLELAVDLSRGLKENLAATDGVLTHRTELVPATSKDGHPLTDRDGRPLYRAERAFNPSRQVDAVVEIGETLSALGLFPKMAESSSEPRIVVLLKMAKVLRRCLRKTGALLIELTTRRFELGADGFPRACYEQHDSLPEQLQMLVVGSIRALRPDIAKPTAEVAD